MGFQQAVGVDRQRRGTMLDYTVFLAHLPTHYRAGFGVRQFITAFCRVLRGYLFLSAKACDTFCTGETVFSRAM